MNVAVRANALQDQQETQTGRPSDFNEETAKLICDELIKGNSLRKICKADNMPDAGTVCSWLSKNDTFRQQYAYAREMQTEALLEDMFEIVDNSGIDVQRARLQWDHRRWALSKLAPKKYGDKLQTEHSGPDGGPIALANVTDEARAKAAMSLLARLKGS